MGFYDRMRATATRLIDQYGAMGTLTRETTGEYDPATGTAAVTTEAFPVRCVVFDYSASLVDGMVIQKGDKQVYMEAIAVTPMDVDRLSWGGLDYQIIGVKPLAPALSAVMFELQIRG